MGNEFQIEILLIWNPLKNGKNSLVQELIYQILVVILKTLNQIQKPPSNSNNPVLRFVEIQFQSQIITSIWVSTFFDVDEYRYDQFFSDLETNLTSKNSLHWITFTQLSAQIIVSNKETT